MRFRKYCIAIMSVGSGVGQSVITSCNLSRLPITTVGLGMNPFAFGAYECDEMDYVPIIYSDEYIPELINKCNQYNVDLIIPGSDDEAHILAKNKSMLEEKGFKVLVSEESLFNLIRDKAKMCEVLSQVADVFVKSYDLSQVRTLLREQKISFPLIAKPRDGYASRGIEILLNEDDLIKINDQHIIQELAIPHKNDPFREAYMKQISKRVNSQLSEISIQVVNDKEGNIIGKMASYNKLNNGVPIEIIPYENEYIWSEIDKLLPVLKEFGHRGPLNIQGRLTDQGLKLFEMNARFTGITGLRAIMGFNEVESCIKNWLDIDTANDSPLLINQDRFGIRQTTDKVISFDNNKKVKELSYSLNKKQLKTRKNVLVTGASGYLGQAVIKLLSNQNYNIIALSRDKDKVNKLYQDFDNVVCYENKDLFKGGLCLGHVDCLIHCGFARPYRNNDEITDSLNYTNQLFNLAAMHQVPIVINISSQSVYGTKQPIYWKEDTPVMPETMYAQAKYCSELMANTIKQFNKHSNVTSLRLSALSGGQAGLVPIDILAKFVTKALRNETIEIIDGRQQMQRLDVRDAAKGIVLLMETDAKAWEPVYNLGAEKSYTILEMAETVSEIAKARFGQKVNIIVKPDNIDLALGMDSTAFYELTNWKPEYDLEDIIISLFDYLSKGEENDKQETI